MRQIIIVLLALLVAGPALAAPDRLTREDLLDMENCQLKIAALQAHENEVLRKYGVGPEDHVLQDGTIARAPKKDAPKKEKK